jgi:hypothetical protein
VGYALKAIELTEFARQGRGPIADTEQKIGWYLDRW